jgi:LuxR family maltose regulon positive regulatory protein
MTAPILATKLYAPPPRPNVVSRPRLIERLDEGLQRKLTLVSAPAGFGKTTLVGEWLSSCRRPAAWLSLDDGDNDLARFLTYLVAALRTIAPNLGAAVTAALQSPQPPPIEPVLTMLINEVATVGPDDIVLVLDDYHVLDAKPVDHALTFLLDHLPPQLHLVIATREDPSLPLARLRARGQLTELRAADLRFTRAEATGFLNEVMGLNLATQDVAALEARTEGWIAGLQLAAVSMQGHDDTSGFVTSFTGSHRFVMDYLVEEVLQQQTEAVQAFLLRTSILDRLCGPLCDAVLIAPAGSGQATLEYLERANLFIVPLDNERRWYRYHHLFGDLLRQQLRQSLVAAASAEGLDPAELHRRASVWLEDNGLELDALHHATAAHDVERAERLIEGRWMPLHFRGGVAPVLSWLESLPTTVLDAHPSLWTAFASTLLATGQNGRVEPVIQAAEAALEGAEPDEKTRDLLGRIAAIRATLAANRYQVETIITESRRALEQLHPNNLAFRTSTAWKLGFAYYLQGDRAAAREAMTDVIAIGQASGNTMYTLLAMIGLGVIQEGDNQLGTAAQTYRCVLDVLGDRPLPLAFEPQLGLARIYYEWNDLATAEQQLQRSLPYARELVEMDRSVAADVLLARLKLARDDAAGAAALLAQTSQFARQHNFVLRLPDVVAAQVVALLRLGDWSAAAELAHTYDLPISQARVYLAQDDPAAALAVLKHWRGQVEAKGWEDQRLKAMALQALAFQANGEKDQAVQVLFDALALAEPGGFVRLFVDEGAPMARLLVLAATRGRIVDYVGRLLTAFEVETPIHVDPSAPVSPAQPLIEPLSQRELEVLRLIAQGLSNQEIGDRLFLALDTVKGHNRKIFGKLQVQRRTEAVARARELGLS